MEVPNKTMEDFAATLRSGLLQREDKENTDGMNRASELHMRNGRESAKQAVALNNSYIAAFKKLVSFYCIPKS